MASNSFAMFEWMCFGKVENSAPQDPYRRHPTAATSLSLRLHLRGIHQHNAAVLISQIWPIIRAPLHLSDLISG